MRASTYVRVVTRCHMCGAEQLKQVHSTRPTLCKCDRCSGLFLSGQSNRLGYYTGRK